jgi:hypothetical protein
MTGSVAGERGAILLHVLVVTTLLTAVAAGVALLARIETLVSAQFRLRHELAAAAAAGAEMALRELRDVPDWSAVLSGGVRARFSRGSPGDPLLVGGESRIICCGPGSLTASLDASSGSAWTPFGWAPLDALTSTASPSPIHVVVWAADDPGDADGDLAADSNGSVRLHVQALAAAGGRRKVTLTVDRTGVPSPFLRIVFWSDS